MFYFHVWTSSIRSEDTFRTSTVFFSANACFLLQKPMLPLLCTFDLCRIPNDPIVLQHPRHSTFSSVLRLCIPLTTCKLTRVQPLDDQVLVCGGQHLRHRVLLPYIAYTFPPLARHIIQLGGVFVGIRFEKLPRAVRRSDS